MLLASLRLVASVAVVALPSLAQIQFDELLEGATLPPGTGDSYATALADIDGDGDLDLVLANREQNKLYVNDGDGAFTDVTATQLPPDSDLSVAVVFGDVDRDGDPDVVFGNTGSGNNGARNKLYLNDGTGTFVDATEGRLPAYSDPTRASAAVDVDRDGDLDLVFGNGGASGQRQTRLYLNDGNGAFTDATTTHLPSDDDDTNGIAAGDVDGDGSPDLILANVSSTRLYLNSGSGVFTDASARLPAARANDVALGDVDSDGDLDLVFSNYLRPEELYLNDGSGTFAAATSRLPSSSSNTLAVTLGDVDADGDLDLVLGNGSQNELYLNDGAGTFSDATATHLPPDSDTTYAVAVGDVNGDGDSDLVFGNLGQSRVHLNQGGGSFIAPQRVPIDTDETLDVALVDVDDDGDLDMICANFLDQNRLYLNDGQGMFRDATSARMPPDRARTRVAVSGDVDGDGDPDLFFGNDRQNTLYLNDGTGVFTEATAGRLPEGGTPSMVLGDVDADGDLDALLAGSRFNGGTRLYVNDGAGVFSDVTTTQLPPEEFGTRVVALGDMDGDGDLDAVLIGEQVFGAVSAKQEFRVYENDGRGAFAKIMGFSYQVETGSLALGDVDGDGDLDAMIAVRYSTGPLIYLPGPNLLLLNDGSGRLALAPARLPPHAETSNDVALGDVDADGDLDAVIGNDETNPGHRLYINDGTGTFTDVTATRMLTEYTDVQAVALGDVDGDFDLDLVSAVDRDRNRLRLNLLRHLDNPYRLRLGRNFRLNVYARYGPLHEMDVALPFLATGTARIPLLPIGVFGLDPSQMVVLPPIVVRQPAGLGSLSLVLTGPGLVGVTVYGQALLTPAPLRLTNVTTDVIQ